MVWTSPEMDLPRGMTASPEITSSSYHNLSNKAAPSLISHYEAAFSTAYRTQSINNNNNNNTPPPLSSPSYLRGDVVSSRYSTGTPTTDSLDHQGSTFHNISSPEAVTAANSPTGDPTYSTVGSTFIDTSAQSYLGNTTCIAPPATTMSFYNTASSMLSNPQHLPSNDYSQFGYPSASCGNYFYSSGYPSLASGYNAYPGMTNSGPLAGKDPSFEKFLQLISLFFKCFKKNILRIITRVFLFSFLFFLI